MDYAIPSTSKCHINHYELARIPEIPKLPKLSKLPKLPQLPELPESPELPKQPESAELTEQSKVAELAEQSEVAEQTEQSKLAELTEQPQQAELRELVEKPEKSEKSEKPEKSVKEVSVQIYEINSQVAEFRDMLISIGQANDCPELREKIRKIRWEIVDNCKNAAHEVLPDVRSAVEAGIPVDDPNLILLFFVTQLFLRELHKSRNLVDMMPMDMKEYYESRAGPSNLGNVISQILLCQQITPDFNQEELCSIIKDTEEITALIDEMQEFMPLFDTETERNEALHCPGNRGNRGGRRIFRRNGGQSSIFNGFRFLCCTKKPNYV